MTSTTTVADEIERYLRTGDSDPYHAAWYGQNFLESAQLAHSGLANAVVAEVSRRATGWNPPPALVAIEDLAAFTRAEVEPMVPRGRRASEAAASGDTLAGEDGD